MAVHPGDEANWSRRYKANLERLSSGGRGKLAEVVRGLSALERDHGLSAGEQRMLRRAWQLLRDLPGGAGEVGVREPRWPLPPTDAGVAALTCRKSLNTTDPRKVRDDRKLPAAETASQRNDARGREVLRRARHMRAWPS